MPLDRYDREIAPGDQVTLRCLVTHVTAGDGDRNLALRVLGIPDGYRALVFPIAAKAAERVPDELVASEQRAEDERRRQEALAAGEADDPQSRTFGLHEILTGKLEPQPAPPLTPEPRDDLQPGAVAGNALGPHDAR